MQEYALSVRAKGKYAAKTYSLDLVDTTEKSPDITVDVKRFAGLNICGFSPIKVFTEILSWYIGHQCSLFTYS